MREGTHQESLSEVAIRSRVREGVESSLCVGLFHADILFKYQIFLLENESTLFH